MNFVFGANHTANGPWTTWLVWWRRQEMQQLLPEQGFGFKLNLKKPVCFQLKWETNTLLQRNANVGQLNQIQVGKPIPVEIINQFDRGFSKILSKQIKLHCFWNVDWNSWNMQKIRAKIQIEPNSAPGMLTPQHRLNPKGTPLASPGGLPVQPVAWPRARAATGAALLAMPCGPPPPVRAFKIMALSLENAVFGCDISVEHRKLLNSEENDRMTAVDSSIWEWKFTVLLSILVGWVCDVCAPVCMMCVCE